MLDRRLLQSFSVGGGAGALALSSSQGNQPMTFNMAHATDDGFTDDFFTDDGFTDDFFTDDGFTEDSVDTAERVKDIFLILLTGIAVLLGLILLTYLLAYAMDHCCCCCCPPITAVDYDQGPVARKAALWGLQREERMRILKHVFQKTTFAYDKSKNDNNTTMGTREDEQENNPGQLSAEEEDSETLDHDIAHAPKDADETTSAEENSMEEGNTEPALENNKHHDEAGPGLPLNEKQSFVVEDPMIETSPESELPSGYVGPRTDIELVAINGADAQVADDSDKDRAIERDDSVGAADPNDGLDDADHERVCCICLGEYEDGCRVMTGTGCAHVFHYDCSMEWLEKHDHCPYCRKEMLTAKQMRTAAKQVLGEQRVVELGMWQGERNEHANVQASTTAAATSTSQSATVDLETGQGTGAAPASAAASAVGAAMSSTTAVR